jgi:ferredoxin/flavodoxin---NADP+ reductase
MAKALIYNATLQQRIDVTEALTLFRILPDEQPEKRPWFEPGQYCVLGMNNDAHPALGSVRRSMSIASAPQDTGPTEFYIRYVAKPASDNPLTHLLWQLKDGDRLYMRPVAAGVFTVGETIGNDDPRMRVMVAAGTGSAPFVSMLRHQLRDGASVDLSNWVLLHGASYAADLGHRDELLAMVERNRLHYWGAVSRPQGSPDWRGDTGRVEHFFQGDRLVDLETRLGLAAVGGLSPSNAAVFICGLQGTIAGVVTALIDRGFVPDFKRIREALGVPADVPASLFYEQYDNEPVINIKDEQVMAPLRQRMAIALAARAGKSA